MTYEEAYLDGFCKAAEAAGINPVQLYKKAGIPGLGAVAGVAGRALGAAKAAPGAIAGGARAVGGAISGAGRKTMSAGQRFLELLKGGNPTMAFYNSAQDVNNAYIKELLRTKQFGKALGIAGAKGQLALGTLAGKNGKEIGSELRKVLAARLGTGAAGLGAAGAGVAALTGGKPDEAQA